MTCSSGVSDEGAAGSSAKSLVSMPSAPRSCCCICTAFAASTSARVLLLRKVKHIRLRRSLASRRCQLLCMRGLGSSIRRCAGAEVACCSAARSSTDVRHACGQDAGRDEGPSGLIYLVVSSVMTRFTESVLEPSATSFRAELSRPSAFCSGNVPFPSAGGTG